MSEAWSGTLLGREPGWGTGGNCRPGYDRGLVGVYGAALRASLRRRVPLAGLGAGGAAEAQEGSRRKADGEGCRNLVTWSPPGSGLGTGEEAQDSSGVEDQGKRHQSCSYYTGGVTPTGVGTVGRPTGARSRLWVFGARGVLCGASRWPEAQVRSAPRSLDLQDTQHMRHQ